MDLLGNGHSGSSANSANHGRGGFGRGRGGNRGRGQGGRGRNSSNTARNGGAGGRGNGARGDAGGNNSKIQCHVCLKFGHFVDRCWHRFEEDYVPEEKNAGAAMNSYTADNTWYTDTGATDHITGELEKLSTREKYNGADQIHTTSGAGMNIKHIGHSTIRNPIRDLQLRNILHVPSAQKNLVSVHRLASDNNIFLEFHPNFFLIKDRDTKNTLVEGPCRKGLYPLPFATSKQVFGVNKVSLDRWHSRLGHPSFPIVEKVLRRHKLPFFLD
jgi:hypothetical protein